MIYGMGGAALGRPHTGDLTMKSATLAAALAPFVNRHNAGAYARLPADGRDALVAYILTEAGASQGDWRYAHNVLRDWTA